MFLTRRSGRELSRIPNVLEPLRVSAGEQGCLFPSIKNNIPIALHWVRHEGNPFHLYFLPRHLRTPRHASLNPLQPCYSPSPVTQPQTSSSTCCSGPLMQNASPSRFYFKHSDHILRQYQGKIVRYRKMTGFDYPEVNVDST